MKWGIISTGRIAKQFCHDLSRVEGAELYGVAARKHEDAVAFKDEFKVQHAFETYEDLFANPDIDIVYIGTPHTLHFEQSLGALSKGKHVLCEKPATINTEQMLALSTVARDKKCVFMEAMWTYFLPAIEQAKQWVEIGRIGRIKHIKADFGYPIAYSPTLREYDPSLGGGCLYEMGIYPLAISHYFLGSDLTNIHLRRQKAPNGVESDVVLTAQLNGAIISLATSFQCKLQNWAYIIGEDGYIAIPDFWRAKSCYLYQLDEKIDEFVEERDTFGFEHEAMAMQDVVTSGMLESQVMPHSTSIWLQATMERLKKLF